MYLLFDIGGTNIRLAVSTDGETLAESKVIPTSADFDQGIQTIKQISNELSSGEKITGVTGGIAGVLDKDKTMLVASPHIRGWIQKPLKLELEKMFDCQVFLENDANLNGLGEAVRGAGAGKGIVAFITLGTGVGGARIVKGKIDQNALGFEPGHQIIIPDGDPCECGGRGHLESYVAGLYLERKYHQKAEAITDPEIWDQVSRYLAIGLNNTIVHWSPDIIILGGSVSRSIPLEKVKSHLGQLLTIFPQAPEIIPASLGDHAGLYGAMETLK